MSKLLLLALLSTFTVHAEDYCFGFLNSVADRKTLSEAEGQALQQGHMDHMTRMNQIGRLLAAGPIMTAGNNRGILVYRCKSLGEAREWTAIDPMVVNGRLSAEFFVWRSRGFGDDQALPEKSSTDAKLTMIRLPLVLLKKTSSWTTEPVEQIAEQNLEAAALRKAGKLRAAGPVLESAALAGIMVFSGGTVEEAEKVAKEMPLVRGGYATVQALQWFVAHEAVPLR